MASNNQTSKNFNRVIGVMVLAGVIAAGLWITHWMEEVRILKRVVERLSADSRAAEVLVTKSEFDETAGKIRTTIKFLEFDAKGQAMPPKYFTFQGNVIQFQSLVIRFEDRFVRGGDKLRGKSAYLFLKAFMLEGPKTQEFEITETGKVPAGYKVKTTKAEMKFEARLWQDFWNYALDPKTRELAGVKNAQIEAPGSIFLPGTIYTLRIEHDGGLRIDSQPIPEILKGENLTPLPAALIAPGTETAKIELPAGPK